MELFLKDGDNFIPATTKIIAEEAAARYRELFIKTPRELHSTGAVKEFLKCRIGFNQDQEFCLCLFMNNNRLLADEVMFSGTINTHRVHLRPILKRCFELGASALIIAHNHPRGDSTPSDKDIEMIKSFIPLLREFDVILLDSMIVGEKVFSFAENRLI